MESSRCISLVKSELEKHGLNYKTIELGEVEINGSITWEKLNMIDSALKNSGLELIVNKNTKLIEKITNAIHQMVYFSDDLPKQNFSDYISNKVDRDYTYLSNIFSREMGITIEKYIIELKIERIKELLVYSDLNLNDIAFKLQYSSVSHLSNQFKKVTGLTPSFFKQHWNTI
jgi:YesN/AraC family two-component response regulator